MVGCSEAGGHIFCQGWRELLEVGERLGRMIDKEYWNPREREILRVRWGEKAVLFKWRAPVPVPGALEW